jgi:hypothetical protein
MGILDSLLASLYTGPNNSDAEKKQDNTPPSANSDAPQRGKRKTSDDAVIKNSTPAAPIKSALKEKTTKTTLPIVKNTVVTKNKKMPVKQRVEDEEEENTDEDTESSSASSSAEEHTSESELEDEDDSQQESEYDDSTTTSSSSISESNIIRDENAKRPSRVRSKGYLESQQQLEEDAKEQRVSNALSRIRNGDCDGEEYEEEAQSSEEGHYTKNPRRSHHRVSGSSSGGAAAEELPHLCGVKTHQRGGVELTKVEDVPAGYTFDCLDLNGIQGGRVNVTTDALIIGNECMEQVTTWLLLSALYDIFQVKKNGLDTSLANGRPVKKSKLNQDMVAEQQDYCIHNFHLAVAIQQDHTLRKIFGNQQLSKEAIPLHVKSPLYGESGVAKDQQEHPTRDIKHSRYAGLVAITKHYGMNIVLPPDPKPIGGIDDIVD